MVKSTAFCTTEEVATVRAAIDSFGVPRTATLLGVSIQALARVAAQIGSRAGTIALVRIGLPALARQLHQPVVASGPVAA